MYPLYRKSFFYIALVLSFLLSALVCADTVLAQTGTIARGKGHGSVSFNGSGTISINGEGVLIASDNASVTFTLGTDAAGKAIEKVPECIPTGNGYCIYLGTGDHAPLAGQNGKAEVSGETIQVYFTGSNIGLTAQGTGTLVLKGYGIYLYDKTVGRWTSDKTGAVILLQP